MKKILFVIPSFAIGGTTSSLEALLALLDKSQIEVGVFALNQAGPRREAFEPFTVLPESVWLSSKIVNGGPIKRFAHNIIIKTASCFRHLGLNVTSFFSHIGGKQLGFGHYDIVVAFVESLTRTVAYYPIKKKFIYIRSEYGRHIQLCPDKEKELQALKRYDKIIGVSSFAQNSVTRVFSELKDKTVSIPNVIDADAIINRSKVKINDPDYLTNKFTIVSIGRMDPVKQFDKIPSIAKQITSIFGPVFRWYIIGGGDVINVRPVQDAIRELGLEDVVICIGEKKNIYPYLKQANLLVHTSKSETFSRVVNDAKILGVPVIVNNYECAPEFLLDGKEGRILPIEEMSGGIIEMINNPECYNSYKHQLVGYKYDNEKVLNRFYSICEL